jgi:hypothetical protein
MLIEVTSDIEGAKYLINFNKNVINEESGYGSNSRMKIGVKITKMREEEIIRLFSSIIK